MIWIWAFNSVIWLATLPFYLLPNSSFLAIPSPITDAVYKLGQYTHWIVYLLGNTAGDAFTTIFAWLAPVLIAIMLWKLLMRLGFGAAFLIRGGGATAK